MQAIAISAESRANDLRPRAQRVNDTKIAAVIEAVRRRWDGIPTEALVLGTGLGGLADLIDTEAIIPYQELCGFPRSTALAHKGQLVCGRLGNATVVALQGRCHLYEGYCFEELTFATRLVAALGARRLIVSNAAGGVNPQFSVGDVMLIDDHINFMFQHLPFPTTNHAPAWRRSFAEESPGNGGTPGLPRHYYCRRLVEQMLKLARQEDIVLQRGVYIGVTGPNYETRAEYRMFRRIGGDAVGMSTIPEVLVASNCGMQVLGFSAITNVARPDAPQHVDAQEVVDVAACAAPKIERLLLRLLAAE